MARLLHILIIFFLITSASIARAFVFFVITHSSTQINSISKLELKEIYDGEQVFWATGKRIRPARLPDDQQVTTEFLQTVLSKSPTQFVQYWRHKLFSGKGLPPKIVDDSERMTSYISDTEGSIGYISSDTKPNDPKIKILEVTD